MKAKFALVLSLAVFATATPAFAGETSAIMRVTATVTESCNVSSGALDFQLDNSPRAQAMAQTSVTLRCNRDTPYEVALDGGTNGDRRMVDPVSGDTLAYEIYSDPSRTIRWGNTYGVDTVSGTADAAGEAVHNAYAVATTDRRIAAGNYADAVVVTVNF